MFAACVEYGMPSLSSGRVSYPYSVTQIGTDLRLNHVFRLSSNFGSDVRETFGHLRTCEGGAVGRVGYGWCDHASNLSLGFAFATSSANLPGEWIGRTPVALSLPRADVSPIATFDCGLPALIPAYPAAASFA